MKKIVMLLSILIMSTSCGTYQMIAALQSRVDQLNEKVGILEQDVDDLQIQAVEQRERSELLLRTFNSISQPLPTNQSSNTSETVRSATSESETSSTVNSSSSQIRRCQAITKAGTQCKRNAQPGSNYCWQHQK